MVCGYGTTRISIKPNNLNFKNGQRAGSSEYETAALRWGQHTMHKPLVQYLDTSDGLVVVRRPHHWRVVHVLQAMLIGTCHCHPKQKREERKPGQKQSPICGAKIILTPLFWLKLLLKMASCRVGAVVLLNNGATSSPSPKATKWGEWVLTFHICCSPFGDDCHHSVQCPA